MELERKLKETKAKCNLFDNYTTCKKKKFLLLFSSFVHFDRLLSFIIFSLRKEQNKNRKDKGIFVSVVD